MLNTHFVIISQKPTNKYREGETLVDSLPIIIYSTTPTWLFIFSIILVLVSLAFLKNAKYPKVEFYSAILLFFISTIYGSYNIYHYIRENCLLIQKDILVAFDDQGIWTREDDKILWKDIESINLRDSAFISKKRAKIDFIPKKPNQNNVYMIRIYADYLPMSYEHFFRLIRRFYNGNISKDGWLFRKYNFVQTGKNSSEWRIAKN